MCLQCSTKATIVVSEILSGYDLMLSNVNHPDWPAGMYALVSLNDPSVIFPADPIADNANGLSDDELEALPDDEYEAMTTERVAQIARDTERFNRERLDIWEAFLLVDAMKHRGYNRDKDGDPWFWLIDYVARKIEEAQNA